MYARLPKILRPARVQGGAVRPAQLRTKPPSRRRAHHRPFKQHNSPSAGRHGAAATATEHRVVAGARRLVGSTLSLAYAEAHPERVTELILFGVTTGRHSEIDWTFRGGLAAFFPEQWDRLVDAAPPAYRGGDIVDAYHRWLNDPDPDARRRAAEEWCTWESATPDWPPKTGLAERFKDPTYALAFSASPPTTSPTTCGSKTGSCSKTP